MLQTVYTAHKLHAQRLEEYERMHRYSIARMTLPGTPSFVSNIVRRIRAALAAPKLQPVH